MKPIFGTHFGQQLKDKRMAFSFDIANLHCFFHILKKKWRKSAVLHIGKDKKKTVEKVINFSA